MVTRDEERAMDQVLLDKVATYAHSCYEEELSVLRTLCRIPSPSHHEERRAAFIQTWLRQQGATDVHVDDANNVICLLGNTEAENLSVFAAHTDVVFDDTDDLPLVERDGKLYAPGVGDDTANLVGLLMATKYLLDHPDELPADKGLLVVANSCEEGLGNLRGTRALFDAYGQRISAFTSFDLYLPQCVSTAVGSHRYRITVRTKGGHSYRDFGQPNAIACLAALIGDLYTVDVPDASTTYNVGAIEGGTTMNSIAAHASALYEYRSTSDRSLATMHETLLATIDRHRAHDVQIDLETIGIRPGNGPVSPRALRELTQRSLDIIRSVTGQEPDQSPASTDANIPLSLGIPANTVGAVTGALLHTRDEWIEAESLIPGLMVILASMLTA